MSNQYRDLTPITGCSGCSGTAGRWGCPKHSPNAYVVEPTLNSYPGDGMGGEVKAEEVKWNEEFEEWFKKECGYSSNEPLVFGRIHLWARYGYLQGRKDEQKVRQGEVERLKEENTKLRNELFKLIGPVPSDDQ